MNFQNADPDIRRLRESSALTADLYDIYKELGNDKYLNAHGLCVKSEYRGRGIAVELLKARKQLLKVIDVPNSVTIFSTGSSQKSAVKAGYTEVASISYEEAQAALPDFDFSEATGSHCRTFILKI